MKHCCKKMSLSIDENGAVDYDASTRHYSAHCPQHRHGTHQKIFYCPWCGTKLPQDLSDEWWDIIVEEYGLKDPNFDDADKIPPEFQTDEWWKKRGL